MMDAIRKMKKNREKAGNSRFFSCNSRHDMVSSYGKRTCVCFVRLPGCPVRM